MRRKHLFFIYISLLSLILMVALPYNLSFVGVNEANAAAAVKKTTKKKTTKKATTKKRTTKRNTRKSTAKKTTAPKEEQPKNDSLTLFINREITEWVPQNFNPGGLRVNSVTPDKTQKNLKISLNENFTYLPVTKDLVNDMRKHISTILPDSLEDYDISLMVGDKSYSYYITTIDKLPEKYRKNIPFVVAAYPDAEAKKGMNGDIVALWSSHGRYYKPGSGAWLWQRPQLFQVVEDTHTMSYILPYVVPMIENAGGYVLLPRERDINRNEVIVDNDTNDEGQIYSQPYYKEMTGATKWETGEGEGFIYDLPDFRDTENPFENGTYRETTTITSGKPSVAAWYADLPEEGEYAVYVSYKTLPNSTEDARYTVNYSGGTKEFKVNQSMGGGTWIYLGTFPFKKGRDEEIPTVTLSNISSEKGKKVTADAVKIGGGMGNISRSDSREDVYIDPSTPEISLDAEFLTDGDDPEENNVGSPNAKLLIDEGYTPHFSTSGMPRFLEGARYWLQWAGMPEEIYSPYHGTDDYKDDYTSRGMWVNYLAGGSRVLPDAEGLNIPIDVTMALHSDAGKKDDDTYIGTLGIYFTNNGDSYKDGTPRSNSRTLTDMLLRQITTDIRQTWEPEWTRRAMWDKTYVEARIPEVPTSLVEFMSHQNFADMRYALDPRFRFSVSRSIYKAIGRFIAERKDRKFVVQPLPVKNFYIEREKKGQYKLGWSATHDPLEPTAAPEKYIIYERTGNDLGFHKLEETSSTHLQVKITDKEIHSYKVVAVNDGGISFPSEILSLKEGDKGEEPILIVNGFTRISAPGSFSTTTEAGFESESDFGVPDKRDISFIGYQTEFRRKAGESFGRSNGNYATTVIAGNTFDFPVLHGKAIATAGKGFVSCSLGALEDNKIKLNDYKIVDLILGKQKTTTIGSGAGGYEFTAFPEKLQTELKDFISKGGDFFISGEYISSDLFDYRSPSGSSDFALNYLGLSNPETVYSTAGKIIKENGALPGAVSGESVRYSNTLNEKNYIVEKPDALKASGAIKATPFFTFSDNGQTAGFLLRNGGSKGAVMSIPFESIEDEGARNRLMKEILEFLEN